MMSEFAQVGRIDRRSPPRLFLVCPPAELLSVLYPHEYRIWYAENYEPTPPNLISLPVRIIFSAEAALERDSFLEACLECIPPSPHEVTSARPRRDPHCKEYTFCKSQSSTFSHSDRH
jgi:hypothetical protein